MLDSSDVHKLLMSDERFEKSNEEDQEFIVEMTIGKIEEFIVNNLIPIVRDEDGPVA